MYGIYLLVQWIPQTFRFLQVNISYFMKNVIIPNFTYCSLKMNDINRVKFSQQSAPLSYSIVGIGKIDWMVYSFTSGGFLTFNVQLQIFMDGNSVQKCPK